MKKIAHIDLNAFFAECEILKDPSLRGKPMVVGYDSRRSVVSTASYEARKFGIRSGMAIPKAKKLCPPLIIKEVDFSFYKIKSREFMTFLQKRFPLIEKASIDECYIDMTDYLEEGKEHEMLFDLQMGIFKSCNLKCSIGLSYNRFLAKMASDMHKPLGITIIRKEDIETVLWPLPIEDMYGVGKKTAPKLKGLGIEIIGDLATTPESLIRKHLGRMSTYLIQEANGIASDIIDTSTFDPKSISAERTFSEDVSEYEEIRSMIHSCVLEISEELFRYKKETNTVSIKWRTPDFRTKSKQKSLDRCLVAAEDIFHIAMQIFDETYQGEPIRLIGVGLEKVKERTSGDKYVHSLDLAEMNELLTLGGTLYYGTEKRNHDN